MCVISIEMSYRDTGTNATYKNHPPQKTTNRELYKCETRNWNSKAINQYDGLLGEQGWIIHKIYCSIDEFVVHIFVKPAYLFEMDRGLKLTDMLHIRRCSCSCCYTACYRYTVLLCANNFPKFPCRFSCSSFHFISTYRVLRARKKNTHRITKPPTTHSPFIIIPSVATRPKLKLYAWWRYTVE